MRIGINLFEVLVGEGSGVGAFVYIKELIGRLLKLDQTIDYVLFVNRQVDVSSWFPTSSRIQQYRVPFNAQKKWFRPFWEQIGLPFVSHQLGLDVIHSPFSTTPLFHPDIPTVFTLHDSAYFFYQENYPGEMDLKAKYYITLQPLMARAATHIIADSDFSRQQAILHFKIAPNKITAVHLGPGQSDWDIGETFEHAFPDAEHGQRYIILTVASGLLHKNLLRLLDAFARASLPENLQLVLVGG